MKPTPNQLNDYHWTMPITTRWMDNDLFGHVNNVVYYSYFDTIANSYLVELGGFQPQSADVVGYMVASQCNYFSAISYPDQIVGAFRVNRIGRTSVEYGVAIFKEGVYKAAAQGTMTHVFVDRATEQPAEIPTRLRVALEAARRVTD